jgi:hypothetical protein
MGLGRFIFRAIVGFIGLAVLAFVGLLALGAFFTLVGFAILMAKVALVVMIVSWLFRKMFGGSRRHHPVLVGPPIAEVRAPLRDKYEIEAERELDRDLGI